MISQDLITQFDSVDHVWSRASNLQDLVKRSHEAYDAVSENLTTVFAATDNSTSWTAIQGSRGALANVVSPLKQISPRAVFAEIERIGSILENATPETVHQAFRHLDTSLYALSVHYEAWLHDHQLGTTWELIQSAAQLALHFDTFHQSAALLADLAADPNDLLDNEASLELRFEATPTLGDLQRKIGALLELYERIGALIGVSASEEPLRLERIEVGSLWLQLAGNERVLGILGRLLTRATKFLHMQFSSERKVGGIPRQAEAAMSVLNLRQELLEAGLDVSNMDANLEQAAAAIASELNRVVGGEAAVRVNAESVELSENEKARFLNASRSLSLPPSPPNESGGE